MRTMPRNATRAWAMRPVRGEAVDRNGNPTGEQETVEGTWYPVRVNSAVPTGGWSPGPFGNVADMSLAIVSGAPVTFGPNELEVGDRVSVPSAREPFDPEPAVLRRTAFVVDRVQVSPNSYAYGLKTATGLL